MKRALKVCAVIGCSNLTIDRNSYCDDCLKTMQRRESTKRRADGTHDEYGPRWRAVSRKFLDEYPWCAVDGCGRRSEIAHHVVARDDGGSDGFENLIAMCRAHHTQLHKIKTNERDH